MLVLANINTSVEDKMKISTVAQYIDQPVILNNLQKKMPALLILGGAGFGLHDTFKHSHRAENENEKRGLKNIIIISSTVAASLMGARGLKIGNKRIFKGLLENKNLSDILKVQKEAVEKYLSQTKIGDERILNILQNSNKGALKLNEIEVLQKKLPKTSLKDELLKIILPKPENLDSKGIFSEIKRLSILGLVPVLGGIGGGIAADAITGTGSKKSVSNKIKEGFYQYFANIFLCNVGAGAALFGAERLQKAKIIQPLTPLKRLAVIMTGIVTTGILGGSMIANYLSKKIINPLFEQKNGQDLYAERKPEMLDVALHVDDIATAGVLSGFKWIEPALPFLYFISGYRAGIGYRNGHGENKKNNGIA